MANTFSGHVSREAIVNGITNCLFNGLIAWWLVKQRALIPVWGGEGLALDFVATAIALVFIVSLIVMPLTRRKVSAGTLPQATAWPAGRAADILGFMARRHLLASAALLALFAALVFVPPILLMLQIVGVSSLAPAHFALFKGVWAGLMAAAMVVPMIAIVAYQAHIRSAMVAV